MFNKIINFLSNKRVRYVVVTFVLIVFCLALNVAFSSFTYSNGTTAFNTSVKGLEYSMTVDGIETDIIAVPANDETSFDVVITALSSYSSKYELYYDICNDSSCNSVSTSSASSLGLDVLYSSRTIDLVNGTVEAAQTKNIRIITTSTNSDIIYLKLKINNGYSHNTLTYKNMIVNQFVEYDIKLNINVLGVHSSSLPTVADYEVSSNITVNGIVDSNASCTATWNSSSSRWEVSFANISSSMSICNLSFGYPFTPQVFAYNGGVQEFTFENAGVYKLEVWGAAGADSGNAGGKGGYASGIYSATAGTKIYIVVGGSGTTGSKAAGGYNGGGQSGSKSYSSKYPGSGGGATHIALVTGTLSSLSSSKDNILVVAGGGGGSPNYSGGVGGAGGGATGGNGTSGAGGNYYAGGGSQSAGGKCGTTSNAGGEGAFGQGGNASTSTSYSYAGGGGGGYFGGAGGTVGSATNKNRAAGGGGGSGYVKSTLTNSVNLSGSESIPVPNASGTTTGRSGNGAAVISKAS